MSRIAILGAGGHGRVVADTAELCGWQVVEFFDDSWPARNTNGPWPVVGDSARLLACVEEYDGVIVGIGDNATRLETQGRLLVAGARLTSLVHPAASVSPRASIGAGSVIFAAAVVNVSASLGEGCIINSGAIIEHDCVLADAVHVSPGAALAGEVRVGAMSWVGIGAVVRQQLTIGAGSIVGAGAVVIDNVGDGVTVVGSPARQI